MDVKSAAIPGTSALGTVTIPPLLDVRPKPKHTLSGSFPHDRLREVGIPSAVGRDRLAVSQTEHLGDFGGIQKIVGVDPHADIVVDDPNTASLEFDRNTQLSGPGGVGAPRGLATPDLTGDDVPKLSPPEGATRGQHIDPHPVTAEALGDALRRALDEHVAGGGDALAKCEQLGFVVGWLANHREAGGELLAFIERTGP
jgi:hypothetical protein